MFGHRKFHPVSGAGRQSGTLSSGVLAKQEVTVSEMPCFERRNIPNIVPFVPEELLTYPATGKASLTHRSPVFFSGVDKHGIYRAYKPSAIQQEGYKGLLLHCRLL